jgi:large subunit ribosomal protein L9
MPMELILTEDVEHLGKAGELVRVKSGYGRNYLLPKGMAVAANRRNISELEHKRRQIESQVSKQREAARSIADRLNMITLQFERKVGDDDKLFGSVTARDIAEQLEVAGLKLDHRKLKLAEPIKALGKYEIDVKLDAGVKASLKFWVVAESEAKP